MSLRDRLWGGARQAPDEPRPAGLERLRGLAPEDPRAWVRERLGSVAGTDAGQLAQVSRALAAHGLDAPGARFGGVLARGLLTGRVLAHELERPWPWAFTRQLDPDHPAWLPQAPLPAHLNVAGRTWTTVSLPGHDEAAIVDPAGWVTVGHDGPSLAVWAGDGRRFATLGPLPGLGADPELDLAQTRFHDGPFVRTTGRRRDIEIQVDVFPAVIGGRLVFGVTARALLLAPAPRPVQLAFAIRPANPEAVSPIFRLERRPDGTWWANARLFAFVRHPGQARVLSSGADGDAYARIGGVLRQRTAPVLPPDDGPTVVECPEGLATGVEVYRTNLSPGETFKRTVYLHLEPAVVEVLSRTSASSLVEGVVADWAGRLESGAALRFPVYDRLTRDARTTLLALTGGHQVWPGVALQAARSVEDASFHLAALTRLGFVRQAADALLWLLGSGGRAGRVSGADDAADATGAAVWAFVDHVRLTGDREVLSTGWGALGRAVRHLETLALAVDGPLPGLLWTAGGLRLAALGARWLDRTAEERRWLLAHGALMEAVRRRLGSGPVPSQGSRMDAAGVRNLLAVWPLELLGASEAPMRETVAWILRHRVVQGGVYRDVGLGGVHPESTALLALARLAAGDGEALTQLDLLAEQASSTGCWPRALHPDRGGVSGEGDCAPAAAAWVLLMRELLVHEDATTLHLMRGTDARWFHGSLEVQRLPTRFGLLQMHLERGQLKVIGRWRERPRRIVWHKPEGLPGVLTSDVGEASGSGPVLELG